MSAGTACGGSMLAVRSVVRNSVRGLWFRPAVARATLAPNFYKWWHPGSAILDAPAATLAKGGENEQDSIVATTSL